MGIPWREISLVVNEPLYAVGRKEKLRRKSVKKCGAEIVGNG
jgi:hypothetical protein